MNEEIKKELTSIAMAYCDVMDKNNWVKSDESKELADKYNSISAKEKCYCMECGRTAKIDCEFH